MTLKWKKYHPLTDQNAFICLVDHMGNDAAIVQAARVSYGKDQQEGTSLADKAMVEDRDRQLIRYLMNHSHTTPFEMVEIKFMVQVPMDCWRQWIRHRTASVNEYSTRYTEALDFFQVTSPQKWRLQATNNKQGSSGYLPEDKYPDPNNAGPFKTKLLDGGHELSIQEHQFHAHAKRLYKNRLKAGVAKEQARKDLPLSTYTRAYWKCDLHNIFNFLRLRMDSHAQLEIRSFANCMFEIVKQLCPIACEAFEDYILNAKKFSRMELKMLREIYQASLTHTKSVIPTKPDSMTDREWKEFLGKVNESK
jgi:thymidylate synthase (FAD)